MVKEDEEEEEEKANGGLNGAGFGWFEIWVPPFGGLGSISMTSGLGGPQSL